MDLGMNSTLITRRSFSRPSSVPYETRKHPIKRSVTIAFDCGDSKAGVSCLIRSFTHSYPGLFHSYFERLFYLAVSFLSYVSQPFSLSRAYFTIAVLNLGSPACQYSLPIYNYPMASSQALTSRSSFSYPTIPASSSFVPPRRKKQRKAISNCKSMPRTRTANDRRPLTAATSTTNALLNQEIIVAVSESRGISPIVGLAILNLSSAEVVLCQICDTQTYVRTIHKISVFGPTEILFAKTAQGGKLFGLVEENLVRGGSGVGRSRSGTDGDVLMTCIDRKYWNEAGGIEYVQQLALLEDVEALKVSLGGNFYAASSLSAVSSGACEYQWAFSLVSDNTTGREICRACSLSGLCLPVSSHQV